MNDVYLRGRKICGILTEAVSDFESGGIDTVVVGIGINYREPEGGFPEEIRQTAGVVCEGGKIVPRNVLVAEVANELYRLYEGLSQKTFMEDYKSGPMCWEKKCVFPQDMLMCRKVKDSGSMAELWILTKTEVWWF